MHADTIQDYNLTHTK